MDVSDPPSPTVLALPVRLNVLLALTVLTAIYCVAITLPGVPGIDAVTIPLGLLTLLFTPGYGLVAVGVGERQRWPWYLTTVVIVGVSVAFNVALGLLLVTGHYGVLPLVLGIASLLVLFLGGLAQFVRRSTPADARFANMVRSELGLHGYSTGQRAVALTLLVAILLVIAGLTYIASVNPREKPDVSLGIAGTDGSATSLPIGFPNMTATVVVVTVGNAASTQAWTLRVSANATLAGNSTETPYVPPPVANYSIPWGTPLYLANGAFGETTLGVLGPNVVLDFNVTLQFNTTLSNKTGSFVDYTVTFELLPTGGGAPVRSASWYYEIRYLAPSAPSVVSLSGGPWD